MIWMIVAVLVAIVVIWFAWCARSGGTQKPQHFREPIPAGQFRVIACDELGGSEINRAIGDFPSFESAQKEAAKGRQDSELQVGSKGRPTKFLIYDDKETFVGDWTGPKSAA